MVLEEDVLSRVFEYVDSIDKTPRRGGASSTVAAVPGQQVLLVCGGAECRRVSRSWRVSIERALGRVLPPTPSAALAALLSPGRLRFVLLSCRYNHEQGLVSAYDALVSRAEAVGLRLREAVAARGELYSSAQLAASQGLTAGVAAAEPSSLSSQERSRGGTVDYNSRHYVCYRLALKRAVGKALESPVFSWCSTLGQDDSRLLEGCVGASSLLSARWFSE